MASNNYVKKDNSKEKATPGCKAYTNETFYRRMVDLIPVYPPNYVVEGIIILYRERSINSPTLVHLLLFCLRKREKKSVLESDLFKDMQYFMNILIGYNSVSDPSHKGLIDFIIQL